MQKAAKVGSNEVEESAAVAVSVIPVHSSEDGRGWRWSRYHQGR